MARPKKKDSDLFKERIEFRGIEGTKELLSKIQRAHSQASVGATVRYLADEEAKRLGLSTSKEA